MEPDENAACSHASTSPSTAFDCTANKSFRRAGDRRSILRTRSSMRRRSSYGLPTPKTIPQYFSVPEEISKRLEEVTQNCFQLALKELQAACPDINLTDGCSNSMKVMSDEVADMQHMDNYKRAFTDDDFFDEQKETIKEHEHYSKRLRLEGAEWDSIVTSYENNLSKAHRKPDVIEAKHLKLTSEQQLVLENKSGWLRHLANVRSHIRLQLSELAEYSEAISVAACAVDDVVTDEMAELRSKAVEQMSTFTDPRDLIRFIG